MLKNVFLIIVSMEPLGEKEPVCSFGAPIPRMLRANVALGAVVFASWHCAVGRVSGQPNTAGRIVEALAVGQSCRGGGDVGNLSRTGYF